MFRVLRLKDNLDDSLWHVLWPSTPDEKGQLSALYPSSSGPRSRKEKEADELSDQAVQTRPGDDIKGQRTRMKTTCRVSVDAQKNAISTFPHHSTHGLPPPHQGVPSAAVSPDLFTSAGATSSRGHLTPAATQAWVRELTSLGIERGRFVYISWTLRNTQLWYSCNIILQMLLMKLVLSVR